MNPLITIALFGIALWAVITESEKSDTEETQSKPTEKIESTALVDSPSENSTENGTER